MKEHPNYYFEATFRKFSCSEHSLSNILSQEYFGKLSFEFNSLSQRIKTIVLDLSFCLANRQQRNRIAASVFHQRHRKTQQDKIHQECPDHNAKHTLNLFGQPSTSLQ